MFSIRGFPHHNKFVCFFALCLSDCLMPHINNGHIDVYNKRLKSSGLRTRSCFFHSFFSIHRSMLCEKKTNPSVYPVQTNTATMATATAKRKSICSLSWLLLDYTRSLVHSLFCSWAIFIVFELFPINGSIVTVSLSISSTHSFVCKLFFHTRFVLPHIILTRTFCSDIEFILLFDCKYFCADDSCPTHFVMKNLSSQY